MSGSLPVTTCTCMRTEGRECAEKIPVHMRAPHACTQACTSICTTPHRGCVARFVH
jgi:hypothetical protein